MANVTTTPKMTAEEFFAWANRPENTGKRYELEDGEVVKMPSPGELHGTVCWLVSLIIGNYLFARKAGYVCTNDTGLLVRRRPDTVRGPDLQVFLKSKPVSSLSRKYPTDLPSLVVEVLSPHDALHTATRRAGQYLSRGVPLVWLIDPLARVVYVLRHDEYTKVLDEHEEITGNGVLPDFRCQIAEFFALPGQENDPTPPSTPPKKPTKRR